MYENETSEIVDIIIQKFNHGRTFTIIRFFKLSLAEQKMIQMKLKRIGIHCQFEQDLLTSWAN